MTIPTLTGLIGVAAIVMGAVATVYKLKPDRDVLMITQAQGASTILNDLVETLREEVTRERLRNQELREENKKLQDENEGFRKRFGTRTEDV